MEAERHEPTPLTSEDPAPSGHEAEDQPDPLLERLQEVDRRARALIRKHPTTVLVAAVALGFLMGRILR